MDLELVHDNDKAIILYVSQKENIVFKMRERCIFYMAIRDDALIINLDRLKTWQDLIKFPQAILHEFFHFISRYSYDVAVMIHKINRKTRGLFL